MMISLEFGSSNIKIFDSKNGLIYYEPSMAIVKVNKRKATIVSFGKEAYDLCEQLEEDEKVIQPIKNGFIADFHMAKLLLDKVFDTIIGARKKRKALEVILCVPTCATAYQIDEFVKLLNGCGIFALSIKPQLNCVCKLLDDDISRPYLIVDIGAGKTEIGLTTTKNVIDAINLSLGGELINLSIQETIKEQYNIFISKNQIEHLKQSIGSLYSTDATTTKVVGQNLLDGTWNDYAVSSQDIYEAVIVCYDKIIEAIKVFIASLDNEYQEVIKKTGIFFSGLGCEITGFEKYVQSKLDLEVYILDTPATAVVEGALV